MRLINIKTFLEREQVMSKGGRVDRRTKVLESVDDESTKYAILSHRWINPTEVDYEEMVDLAKMESEARDEIRQRPGYKKILDGCEQAKRDGYEWLWVDACCIDKRSSAELSEAINSMFRWYEGSGVCYAYLHDVPCSSFPTVRNRERYHKSNGWPEWFSRGWTLQEMIATRIVHFFNKDWHHIGDKKTLSRILSNVTRVPQHILTDGLSSNRPCIAQIMSWAADWTTTRVEDRAYSLMGLLDVNIPMLYGEGKKAFHRLQLEIIRMSNDQSIFAWGCNEANVRSGSILADDPSFFRKCHDVELMDFDQFVQSLKDRIPETGLLEEDRFGTFPITNRGIQIWLPLRPCSPSVFQAWLPCRSGSFHLPVTINLALWNSNYYRYSSSVSQLPTEKTVQFRQLYLRYEDIHHDITFEIDDSAVTENGFACCDAYPLECRGNTLTLTGMNPLCVRVYSDRQGSCRFAVAFGQYFGQDWIHCACVPASRFSWSDRDKFLVRGPERVQSMAEAPSRSERYGHIWFSHTFLHGSSWIARTCRVMWEKSRIGVRIEVFRHPGSGVHNGPDEWRILGVEASAFFFVHTYN